MIVAFVVAVADNGVIGRQGQLPWRMPSDLKRFRRLTLGKPVIMGRKTYQSIGRPLDGRDNIVVTRQKDFRSPGVHVSGSVAEAVKLARELAARRGVDEISVIGGADIFRDALPMAQRVYLTRVHGNPEGDILLAPFDPAEWRETHREPMQRSTGDQFSADFVVLDRQP
jgi:dihydrofolate reductase